MPKELLAKIASVYDDGYCTTISFANSSDNPTDYLILQTINYPSKQDIDLDQDGIYVQLNDQSKGGYNCIKSIFLANNSVCIHLLDDIPIKQDIERDLIIRLLIPEEDVTTLKTGLEIMASRLKTNPSLQGKTGL